MRIFQRKTLIFYRRMKRSLILARLSPRVKKKTKPRVRKLAISYRNLCKKRVSLLGAKLRAWIMVKASIKQRRISEKLYKNNSEPVKDTCSVLSLVKYYQSPCEKLLDSKMYTSYIYALTFTYMQIFEKLKLSQHRAQALTMTLFGGGETGRTLGIIIFAASQKEFAKEYFMKKFDLSSLFSKNRWHAFDKETQYMLSNVNAAKLPKFVEFCNMSRVNKYLTYTLEFWKGGVLPPEEKSKNLSGNANPDFFMTIPDPQNPGRFLKVYYDCKNSFGELKKNNHLRPFPAEQILGQTLRCFDLLSELITNALLNIPECEKPEAIQILGYLADCKKHWENTKDAAVFISTYNNVACKFGAWMHRNSIPFNMTVKMDLEDFHIDPELSAEFIKIADHLANDPKFLVRTFFENLQRNPNKLVTETSLFMPLVEILKTLRCCK